MVTNVRGVRDPMCPKTSLAIARNAAQSSVFMERVEKTSRARLKPFNGQAVAKFKTMASTNLERLKPSQADAKAVLLRVKEREASGELDALTSYSESVGPEVVLGMSEFLEQLFEKAVTAENSFALMRVFVATRCLSGYVEDKLLVEQKYPKERSVSDGLVQGSVSLANTAFSDVVESLCAVHNELGMALPEFPQPPTVH